MSCELGLIENVDHLYVFVEFPSGSLLTRNQINRFIELFRNLMDPKFVKYWDFEQTYNDEHVRWINESYGFVIILNLSRNEFSPYIRPLRNTCNQVFELITQSM